MSRYKDLMELAETFEQAALEHEEQGRICRRAHQQYLRQAIEWRNRNESRTDQS